MSFTTLGFLLFMAVAATGWFLLPQKLKKLWLLTSSYTFYMWSRPAFGLLLLSETAVCYGVALAVKRRLWGRRKLWAALGLIYILGALFLFKYSDFFLNSFLSLVGYEKRDLGLVLPIGISFISFSLSAYIFDVYRGKIKAEQNFIDFALFAAFFPTLLAGPINRARELLPQIKKPVKYSALRLKRGLMRFTHGAAKKLICADLIGCFVDAVYCNTAEASAGAVLLAVFAYSLQIYFDFSAYSDMALGTADMLGFNVMENFKAPYLSRSVKDFWKKWHISLTSWFREYLYFPLGGSRVSTLRTQLNVLIVFIVSGLWHGADYTFIIWGFLNGLYQVVGALTSSARKELHTALHINEDSCILSAIQGIFTFLLITAAWVFFRAGSFEQALLIFKKVGSVFSEGFGFSSVLDFIPARQLIITAVAIVPCIIEDIRINRNKSSILIHGEFRYYLTLALYLFLICIFGVYGQGFDPQDFVYFKF